MGNSATKEARHDRPESDAREQYSGSSRRTVGAELGIFHLAGPSGRNRDDQPFTHRETRAEREARRRERDNILRIKERERSLREEHVDGGYLVTLGVYTGPEDFSKQAVRHLQIERKLAPFWRGLDDWSSSWAEHQLVAAARGLPIPAADAPPDPELISMPPPRSASNDNNHSLAVPVKQRSSSVAGSDRISSGVSTPTQGTSPRTSKSRTKSLAAALSTSRNVSSTDLSPREAMLPHDPYINGQPMEVYLYKDAEECPICFMSYPPYLNLTRCCGQAICSECFVQIKRADPHLPEHHPNGEARDPNEELNPEDSPEMLISEPAQCPYCQQKDFGVTYDPPPFRRGLTHFTGLPTQHTAASSQSSLHPETTASTSHDNLGGRRRTHSLSASAPNVITTDRVRPDWATKLAAVRSQQARRSAAATALHHAAFYTGGGDSRALLRGGPRFGRRGIIEIVSERDAATAAPGDGTSEDADDPEASRANARRTRMEELEEMMFLEAVRLSIAAEEERKRKDEKAQRKEAKKREKEERKAQKKQSKGPYSGGASGGASRSSLSLGLNRLRGNSGASNLRVEATVQAAALAEQDSANPSQGDTEQASSADKGKAVDRSMSDAEHGGSSETSLSVGQNVSSKTGPRGGHLRQLSTASSIISSIGDSPTGSYRESESAQMNQLGHGRDEEAETGTEPLFNFRSLAEMVGVNIDDGTVHKEGEEGDDETSPGSQRGTTSARPLSQVKEEDDLEATETEHVEGDTTVHRDGISPVESSQEKQDLSPNPDTSSTAGTSPSISVHPPDSNTVPTSSEDKKLGHPSVTEHPAQVS